MIRLVARSALTVAVLAACAVPEPEPREPAIGPGIVGTWRVARYEDALAAPDSGDGLVGPAPLGYVVYAPSGHVLVHIQRSLPGRVDSDALASASADELRDLVSAFTGYVGRYTLDTARHEVTHIIEGEWPPRRGPIESVTPYELRGDTLVIGRPSARWTLVRVE